MQSIPYVLAAFRPGVKLTEMGSSCQTVQMLFRRTSKRLKNPDEYFTYKAHPTVFEGSWVDDLALVKAAHEIAADTIPPMVQMKVVSERTNSRPARTTSIPAPRSWPIRRA